MPLPRLAAAIGIAAFAATSYSATLTPPPGSPVPVNGTAGVKGTSAWVKLTGGKSGDVYPWHVHVGMCGTNGPVFGDASAYKPITISSAGKGDSKATLSMALPDTGSYYVNIHASSSDMKTIVSCGNLTKGM